MAFAVSHLSVFIFCETWAIISRYLASCLILSPSSRDSVAASASAGFQIFNPQSLDPILLWSTTWGMGIQGGHCTAMSGIQSAHGHFFSSEKEMQADSKGT